MLKQRRKGECRWLAGIAATKNSRMEIEVIAKRLRTTGAQARRDKRGRR